VPQIGLDHDKYPGVDGMDISSIQFLVDWERASLALRKFSPEDPWVYIRGGLGPSPSKGWVNRVDGMAERHYRGATSAVARLRAGFYWFGKPVGDPILQAQFFAAHCPWKLGDLPPVLDLEVMDYMTPLQVAAWAVAFLTEADACFRKANPGCDVSVVFYSYLSFINDTAVTMNAKWWGNRLLWLAKYDGPPVAVPPFTKTSFYQYDGNEGLLDGVLDAYGRPAACDRDRFLGTPEELAALCFDENDPYAG
jgi:GH25 family lysozyme M1 (1,4-beta-N-acetylmuramidase)